MWELKKRREKRRRGDNRTEKKSTDTNEGKRSWKVNVTFAEDRNSNRGEVKEKKVMKALRANKEKKRSRCREQKERRVLTTSNMYFDLSEDYFYTV